MLIAVDFDGTIVEHEFPKVGAPVHGAIFWMREWIAAGANVILWTMRSGDTLDQAVEYLTENAVDLYGINKNPGQGNWTSSPKAYAHVYVDDAAYGCPLIISKGVRTDDHGVTRAIRPFVDWNIVGPAVMEMIKRDQT